MLYRSNAQRNLALTLVLLLLAWLTVFWQGICTAVEVWMVSDIFNHCIFVIPGACYLIYLKRNELEFTAVRPAYFAFLCCFGLLVLYAIGLAGDVKLFMHIAAFAFLPSLLWAMLGSREAKKIMFPLLFMLFCIPIGEELIPTLQKVTADLSVMMLRWTNIPIYRTGLYLEIPQGRFLVAEACSGISFLIASTVIGVLYSYLNMHSMLRRITFISISVIVPIIANAVRVFGTVVIGYVSDMEYAVGADHLIYGWFFFLFVIICLLAMGELFRQKEDVVSGNVKTPVFFPLDHKSGNHIIVSVMAMSVMIAAFLWFNTISLSKLSQALPQSINKSMLVENFDFSNSSNQTWQPNFNLPYDSLLGHVKLDNVEFAAYFAWYPLGHGELISSINRLYEQRSWTLDSVINLSLLNGEKIAAQVLVSPTDSRLLVHWYVIDGKIFFDEKLAKLYEIYQIMRGRHHGSGIIALSTPIQIENKEQESVVFGQLVAKNLLSLSQSMAIISD